MVYPTTHDNRRPLHAKARAVAPRSFSTAALGYLALAIGVVALGMLAAYL
jgi:hypothetical protein